MTLRAEWERNFVDGGNAIVKSAEILLARACHNQMNNQTKRRKGQDLIPHIDSKVYRAPFAILDALGAWKTHTKAGVKVSAGSKLFNPPTHFTLLRYDRFPQ